MKKVWLLVAVVVFLYSGGAMQSRATAFQAVSTLSAEAQTIVDVVSSFYKEHIRSLEEPDLRMDWRTMPQVSTVFVRKIEELLAEAAKTEPGYLGYDPFLMAQDWPETMEYDVPVIDGDTAELVAYTVWGTRRYPLCVTLAHADGLWRITDIIDMEMPDVEGFECGGLKTAQDAK